MGKGRISLLKIKEYAKGLGCEYEGMVCLKNRKKIERVLFLKFTLNNIPFWVFYDSKSEMEIDSTYEALVGISEEAMKTHPYLDYVREISNEEFGIISVHENFSFYMEKKSGQMMCYSELVDPIIIYQKMSSEFKYDQLVETDFPDDETIKEVDGMRTFIDRTLHGSVIGVIKFSSFIKDQSSYLQIKVENMQKAIKEAQDSYIKSELDSVEAKTLELIQVFKKLPEMKLSTEVIFNKIVHWKNLVNELYSL